MLGLFALIIIHASSLPTIFGYSESLPPLNMVLLLWIGIFLFIIDACKRRQYLYAIGSGVGLLLQTIVLIKVLYN